MKISCQSCGAKYNIADEKVRRAEVTVHKPSAPIPRLFTDVRVVAVRERR